MPRKAEEDHYTGTAREAGPGYKEGRSLPGEPCSPLCRCLPGSALLLLLQPWVPHAVLSPAELQPYENSDHYCVIKERFLAEEEAGRRWPPHMYGAEGRERPEERAVAVPGSAQRSGLSQTLTAVAA